MDTRIYVDGRITRPEVAVIPVLDHGFLYGDSVYEVLWWHRGVLIQEEEHLQRLEESGRHIYMELQPTREELVEAVRRTSKAAGVTAQDDAYVRIVVTRGSGPLGLSVTDVKQQSVIVVVAPASRPSPEEFEQGLRVAVVERRRNPSLALDPRAKTGNYLNNVLALHEARLAGADDALMLNEQGDVAEASTSNVYLILDGLLLTPPVEAGILKGTTRTRILALAAAGGVEAREEPVSRSRLDEAAEVFVSSSVRGILPVVEVDGLRVGDGGPGPLTRRLRAWFEDAADREAERAAQRVRDGGSATPAEPETP